MENSYSYNVYNPLPYWLDSIVKNANVLIENGYIYLSEGERI